MIQLYINENKNLVVVDLTVTPNITKIFKSTDPIYIEVTDEMFCIRKVGTDVRYVYEKYDRIQNEATELYTSVDDIVDDIKSFFVGSDFSTLIQAVQNSGGTTLKASTVEITRPANTTVYTANDVIADTSATFIPFTNVSKAMGTGVRIGRVRIQTNDTGFAGKKFNIHLYREAPTFIADNAAFVIDYANASKRLGAIPIVMGAGNMSTVGMNDWNCIVANPVGRDIYFIIETVDGGTPSANSTKFQLTIDYEQSNN